MSSLLAAETRQMGDMTLCGRRLCILWQRFGAYHLARLKGATEVLADVGWDVVGIEVAGRDEYPWRPATHSGLQRRTLFPDGDYTRLAALAIRRRVASALDVLRPDAVCINGWAMPEAVAALWWARRAGARTILMSETFESSSNRLKRIVKKWRVARCDAAIVGGRLHAGYLAELGFPSDRIELGYDVVDNAHFAAPATAEPLWLGVVRPDQFFFANTRFLERKGIGSLLRAFARYRSLHTGPLPPWRLVISGSGEMAGEWKQLASALGVDRHTHWPGFLQYDELPAAYQSAGAFVHSAREEPWGLVVNEAAAAGLPLIVGRKVGAACELVRDGENGFLVEPDNCEEFAERLLRLAGLPEGERRAMGAASQRLVSAFGPQRFGEALRRCLEPGTEA